MHVPSHYTTRPYSAYCNQRMIQLLITAKLSQSTPSIQLLATTLLSSQLVSLCREFDKISLKNLLIYSMRYKNQTHNTIPTDPYDELRRTVFHKAGHTGSAFYSSAIFQQSGTFNISHPLRTMNEQDANIFFKGTLQIYVEFWNAREPLVEYIPHVPNPQDTVELQINSHINKMWSLLSYIKSAIYFPCVNNVHSFKILDKLN